MSFESVKKWALSLVRTRVIRIFVNQNKGKFKGDLRFQNAVASLQLMDRGR
jgi:hypothetical protein